MRSFIARFIIVLGALLLVAAPARAQGQCGTVTELLFPVDLAQFRLAQEFGVASPRHQGRYHTGEDYYGGRGSSYGTPVRALAAGRVTYSAPWGWGRDGGVVIIEHMMPDGSIAYSQYGHMEERAETPFPPRYGCVKAGDVIGSVGNARPAPHLHFEIRTNQPDVPGPGYTWDMPDALGWVQPSAFLTNWEAWLQPAHLWHLDLPAAPDVPPVELEDHSLVYLAANRLRRVTPDGRVLWRVNLERPVVGLFAYQLAAAVVYADGSMQPFALDSTPGERWATNIPLQRQVLAADGRLIFQAADGALVAFGADRQTPLWRLDGVPPVADAFAAPEVLAFLTANNHLLAVSPQGEILDEAALRAPASFAAAPDGGLLVYSVGGLWRVGADGVWSLAKEDAPPGGAGSAVMVGADGGLYTFSRGMICRLPPCVPTLSAYDRSGRLRWQTQLPDVTGAARLEQAGSTLLLVSAGGSIITLNAANGGVCEQMRVYGGRGGWHSLGGDGVLRLVAGAQMAGLKWDGLACA